MIIDSMRIPDGLASLIRTDKWNARTLLPAMHRRSDVDGHNDYQFLTDVGMKADLANLHRIVAANAAVAKDLYGLGSSKHSGNHVLMPQVDIDLGIPLICNSGEPYIWLDYRRNPDRPAVIRLTFEGGNPEWQMIAATFDEFHRTFLGQGPQPV